MNDGRSSNPNFRSPEGPDDLWVTKVWQVECPDQGVVDEVTTARAAQITRTRHWREQHDGES